MAIFLHQPPIAMRTSGVATRVKGKLPSPDLDGGLRDRILCVCVYQNIYIYDMIWYAYYTYIYTVPEYIFTYASYKVSLCWY